MLLITIILYLIILLCKLKATPNKLINPRPCKLNQWIEINKIFCPKNSQTRQDISAEVLKKSVKMRNITK